MTQPKTNQIIDQGDAHDQDYISSDEDEAAAEAWQPMPLSESKPMQFISSKRRKNDIISTLINIYGSQEQFLEVYKQMLDQRILTKPNASYTDELRNLELMKCRFGEDSLHQCDVMLRDIKDSHRLNQQIVSEADRSKDVAALASNLLPITNMQTNIISPNLWQQSENFDDSTDGFRIPANLAKSFEQFNVMFQQIKQRRLLQFKSNLGQVKLTLHFDKGVSETFNVSPLQAAIISQFNDDQSLRASKSITADLIAQTLSISIETAKKELSFWVSHGVIKESELLRAAISGDEDDQIQTEIVYFASKTLDRKKEQLYP